MLEQHFEWWNHRGVADLGYKTGPACSLADVAAAEVGERLRLGPGLDCAILAAGESLGVWCYTSGTWVAGGPHVYGLSLRGCRHALAALAGLANRMQSACPNCGHPAASARMETSTPPPGFYQAGAVPPMETCRLSCDRCHYTGTLRVDNRHPEDLESAEDAWAAIEAEREQTPPDILGRGNGTPHSI